MRKRRIWLVISVSNDRISSIFPKSLSYTADNWNRTSHPMKQDQFGVWDITVPANSPGVSAIPHDSKLKARSMIDISISP